MPVDQVGPLGASGTRTVPVSSVLQQITDNPQRVQDTSQEQILNPASSAALQREAELTKRPNLIIQVTQADNSSDAQRALALIKVHPDDLPCGHLEPTSIGNENLKTTGNIVVIITGPFGGGKDTIARELLNEDPQNRTKAILHTSRPMGNKETNGFDYYFVSRDEFIRMRNNNEFLSWNDLEPGFYGVGLASIKNSLNSRKDVIAAVGPTVAKPLKQGLKIAGIPFVEVFVLPVSRESFSEPGGIDKGIEILKGRLRERNRGKTDETYIELLMQRSRLWFSELERFQHTVENTNGGLETAISRVKNLIEQKKIEYLSGLEDSELAKLSPQLLFLESGETPNITLDTDKFKANKNIAVILTGPSGAGKGTLIEHLSRNGMLKVSEALSHTTRPKGKNETEGKDYYFANRDEFIKAIAKNKLAEWVMVHNGYFFGKSTDHLQERLDIGDDTIFSLNISGANYYKHLFTKLGIPYVDVFLSPVPKDLLTSKEGIDKVIEILRKRIETRNRGETSSQIDERMKIAREWLEHAHDYSYIVENTEGHLEEAAREFTAIVENKKRGSYKD